MKDGNLEESKKIFVCVDGSKISDSLCEYGAMISKNLDLPLNLLNTIEHSNRSKESDISGNIGLGSRDALLEKLSNEEQNESKILIAKGKEILNRLKSNTLKSEVKNLTTLQRHGSLYDNLIDLESEIRVLIIGLKGEESQDLNHKIGSGVEEIIRALHVPTLLVNSEFKTPKRVLIAYDGSDASKRALNMIASTPIFCDVERHIVHICKDCSKSKAILDEAQAILDAKNIVSKIVSIEGNPIDELLKYQVENGIDITAMGAFSHGRFRNVLLGSFTHKMLQKTKNPLLLLR